jgi:hypothetical protein
MLKSLGNIELREIVMSHPWLSTEKKNIIITNLPLEFIFVLEAKLRVSDYLQLGCDVGTVHAIKS